MIKHPAKVLWALRFGIGFLSGLVLLALSKITPAFDEAGAREVQLWLIMLIGGALVLAVLLIVERYWRAKAKSGELESEVLTKLTKNVFEKGEKL